MYPATQIGHDRSVAYPMYRKHLFWAPVLYEKSSRPSAAHINATRCKVDFGFSVVANMGTGFQFLTLFDSLPFSIPYPFRFLTLFVIPYPFSASKTTKSVNPKSTLQRPAFV